MNHQALILIKPDGLKKSLTGNNMKALLIINPESGKTERNRQYDD